MALATSTPHPVIVRTAQKANRWEITQLTINTPPGTVSVTVEAQALFVEATGERSEVVPLAATCLAGDALTTVMADACRRVLLAAGVAPQAVAAVPVATLGGLLYAGIRDAVYAAKQGDGTIPSDAA